MNNKGNDNLAINIHEDNFSILKVKQIDKINYKIIFWRWILMRTF